MAAPITLHHLQLDAVLDSIGRSDRRTLMDRVGRGIHSDTMLRFRQSRAPDGTPWAPLKRRRKRNRTGPQQPLRDTGRLQRSISWQASSAAVVIGTNVAYPAAHQGAIPARNLPARPFLGAAEPQVALIERIVDRWLQEVLNGKPA